jgi:integrase
MLTALVCLAGAWALLHLARAGLARVHSALLTARYRRLSRRYHQALAKRAGVRLTMKTLRRGFGCRYAGKVSAHVLQRLMRHANIKTTLDFYVNFDDAVEEAVLGPKRNAGRNRPSQNGGPSTPTVDATPSADGTSSPSAN